MATATTSKPAVFVKYPCLRYHPLLAPEGQTIRSAAEEAALGDGWVDTPAAFAPGYVRLTDDPPEGTEMHQYVAPASPPIPYPAMRYPRDGGEPVTVSTPDADLALGPDYQDHPWTKAERAEGRPTTSTAPVADDAQAPPVPHGTPPAPDPAGPDGLWDVTVAQAEEVIQEISDAAELDAIIAREQLNPKGPRKGVLSAVLARLDALTTPVRD